MSPTVGCYRPHHNHRLLVLISPKADTHFNISHRDGGRKAESTYALQQGFTACAQGCILHWLQWWTQPPMVRYGSSHIAHKCYTTTPLQSAAVEGTKQEKRTLLPQRLNCFAAHLGSPSKQLGRQRKSVSFLHWLYWTLRSFSSEWLPASEKSSMLVPQVQDQRLSDCLLLTAPMLSKKATATSLTSYNTTQRESRRLTQFWHCSNSM